LKINKAEPKIAALRARPKNLQPHFVGEDQQHHTTILDASLQNSSVPSSPAA
jgi:hypothetical protein